MRNLDDGIVRGGGAAGRAGTHSGHPEFWETRSGVSRADAADRRHVGPVARADVVAGPRPAEHVAVGSHAVPARGHAVAARELGPRSLAGSISVAPETSARARTREPRSMPTLKPKRGAIGRVRLGHARVAPRRRRRRARVHDVRQAPGKDRRPEGRRPAPAASRPATRMSSRRRRRRAADRGQRGAEDRGKQPAERGQRVGAPKTLRHDAGP